MTTKRINSAIISSNSNSEHSNMPVTPSRLFNFRARQHRWLRVAHVALKVRASQIRTVGWHVWNSRRRRRRRRLYQISFIHSFVLHELNCVCWGINIKKIRGRGMKTLPPQPGPFYPCPRSGWRRWWRVGKQKGYVAGPASPEKEHEWRGKMPRKTGKRYNQHVLATKTRLSVYIAGLKKRNKKKSWK